MFGFLLVVADKEEAKDDEVHEDGLGEREALAGETPDALAQREVETLDVVCLSFLLGARLMLVGWHHIAPRPPYRFARSSFHCGSG